MFKIAGILLILAGSSALGFYMSELLLRRLEALKRMKRSMLLLRGDIEYNSSGLEEAFDNLAVKSEKEQKEFFEAVVVRLQEKNSSSFYEIWKEECEKRTENGPLSKKDWENLKKLGETLGYLDKKMQLSSLDYYLSMLELDIHDTIEKTKNNCKLYKCLGIMGGIFLVLIVI